MGLSLDYKDGQTPINESERDGLKIQSISNHKELDEHEQLNIEQAVYWTLQNKFSQNKILSVGFIKLLHKNMFGNVWKWAGEFRKSEKNLGVEWPLIGIELKNLLDDAKFWIENKTYSADETAIRFKHRLVSIHCFPNGNGRHSRIMADIIVESIFGEKVFTWYSSKLLAPDDARKKYIAGIREADRGLIFPLIEFARS